MVTLGNQTKTWSQYKFGRFSDWAGHFDAANGNGQVEIYENVGGKRGALLAKATRFLPPGPVLIAIKGDWPPVSDTPTALGSIEAIANRYEENGLWFHFLILKMIILPRQARDKHGESSKSIIVFPQLHQAGERFCGGEALQLRTRYSRGLAECEWQGDGDEHQIHARLDLERHALDQDDVRDHRRNERQVTG